MDWKYPRKEAFCITTKKMNLNWNWENKDNTTRNKFWMKREFTWNVILEWILVCFPSCAEYSSTALERKWQLSTCLDNHLHTETRCFEAIILKRKSIFVSEKRHFLYSISRSTKSHFIVPACSTNEKKRWKQNTFAENFQRKAR